MLFNPDDLNKQGEKLKTEDFVMSEVDITGYARLVTRFRQDFWERAEALTKTED